MDSLDLQVLQQARDWHAGGQRVWLVTVIETWGSAPRPPGALLALRATAWWSARSAAAVSRTT
jgi:xanthine dehydrogenase accessory factor